MSSGAPAIDNDPFAGVHRIALGAVISVHITISSLPVKQGSLTVADPPVRVARPAHVAPEDIVKPPIGPHEVIVVGGTGGGDATCKHPASATAPITIGENIQRIPVSQLFGSKGGWMGQSNAPRNSSSRGGGFCSRLIAHLRDCRSASSARLNNRSRCIVDQT